MPSFTEWGQKASNWFTGNRASAKAANTAWRRTMEASNTAYQRGVADMKAAGLNPMLAYTQGGASTPQAPTAQVKAAGGEVVQAYTGLMGSRYQGQMTEATTANLRANTAKVAADTVVAQKEAEVKDLEIKKQRATLPQAEEISKAELAQKQRALEIAEQTLRKETALADSATTASEQAKALASTQLAAAKVGLAAAQAQLTKAQLEAKLAQAGLDALPTTSMKTVKEVAIDAFESAGAGVARFLMDTKFNYEMWKQKAYERHEQIRKQKQRAH